jgi:hypothetical protein
MVLDRRNIFSISFTSFNIPTEFCKTERKNVSWAAAFATSITLDNRFSSAW